MLAGDANADITNVLLTIDYTFAVAAEARKLKTDLLVAYHPPIFEALKRITSGSLIFDAIKNGMAIYSPHTALDIAPGGTNDMLADAVGIVKDLKRRKPLKLISSKTANYKLIVYVPEKDSESVADAIYNAGAGHIGNYSRCSFRSHGVGTFLPLEGARPAIGQQNKLERVNEIKLEVLVPANRVSKVIIALCDTHPYEEPAYDLVPVETITGNLGMGRIGPLEKSVSRAELFDRIKKNLGINELLIAGPTTGRVKTAAVCAGACGNHLNDALAQAADVYVTGEMRHHDAIKAAEAGMTVICTQHSNSERPILKVLKSRLHDAHPKLKINISQKDRDPFEMI